MAASISQLAQDLLARHAPGTPLTASGLKAALPALAKNAEATAHIERLIQEVPTEHRLRRGDARQMDWLEDESVELIVTSPPYWTLKQYNATEGQLGAIQSYDAFVEQLEQVWRECHRVVVKGGRLVVVVGDVCLARKKHGRHAVMPLHASIQESCRKTGFANLAASLCGRSSLGADIDREYVRMAARRLRAEHGKLFSCASISVAGV